MVVRQKHPYHNSPPALSLFKGRVRKTDLPPPAPGDGTFHVSTRRGKQFNTLIYAEVDPLNGAGRDAVLMNSDDAATLHLIHGDRVALTNSLAQFEGTVFIAPVARGSLQVHWPEGNPLLPRGERDTASHTPSYSARVRVTRLVATPVS